MKKFLLAILAMAAMTFAAAQATVDMSDRTIADILSSTDQVSILNAMVEFAGLEETLAEVGPFTVFAPVDRAWVGFSTATLNRLVRNPQTLQTVLLYHVVSGEVTSDRLFSLLLADARQRIGDAETRYIEITDPVEALLATGVTSAVTFESVEGSSLEVSSTLTTDTSTNGGRQLGEGDQGMGVSAPVAALRAGGSDLRVNKANIVSVDIIASNGVIHLIDGVLVPADAQLPR